MVDARPIDKGEVAVPLQWIITTATPAEHVPDITAQIDQIAVNLKAIQFGGRKIANPAPKQDSAPSAPSAPSEPTADDTSDARPPF